MAARKRDRISIVCPPVLQDRLSAYTDRTGVPYSELLRRLATDYLERWERTGEPLPAGKGK